MANDPRVFIPHDDNHGQLEGETCNRNGCQGEIVRGESERGCSCHISPPCSSCTESREYCPECDWHAKDEEECFNDFVVRTVPGRDSFVSYAPRPLDHSKIDWRSLSHTHFSMIKEGVMPFGTTQQEVLNLVAGTFGGRFEYWNPSKTEGVAGRFKYVAYTD